MDGGLQGTASAFWATASQGEVVTFFRHLGEDVSMLDDAELQVAARLTGEAMAVWILDAPRTGRITRSVAVQTLR